MGVAGSIIPPGGAPKPDPERVATLRYTLVDEPETCAAFGETARAALVSLNERALAETRSGDLGECMLLLDHVRDRVAALDPARLAPRTGLAGLFDSGTKRLKSFRAGYASVASAVTQSAADIGDRAGALARKGTALETLWSETRDAIADLDAHIAAARGWLANEAPTAPVLPADRPHIEAPLAGDMVAAAHPVEDAADAPLAEASEAVAPPVESSEAVEPEAEAAVEPDAAPSAEIEAEPAPLEEPAEAAAAVEPTPVAALPHPLEIRLATLEAVRMTAIGRLPLLRAAQNADCRAPAALKQVCDGVEAWRADWHDALGLASKRPKKIRPDQARMTAATSALTDRIDAVGRELSAAQGRRAELEARATPSTATAALAA